MQLTEATEVRGIVERMCKAVLSSAPSSAGISVPALKQIVGIMLADDNMLHLNTYATAISVAMEVSRVAGATLAGMGRVRAAALAEAPKSLPATETVLATIRLCLAQEARIAAAMTYRSRDDVDTVSRAMNAAFEDAAIVASDDLDAGTYSAIITAQASVTKLLADKGRQRPRVINYSFTTTMTSLHMSQRLYGAGSRSSELSDENKVVHPAFMPRNGRALAL